ncbi:hypothetical protein BDN72DRAFT_901828 [Pluteus cervinus]|uniref:Uncharacterized protein n=1 Tax=Pluteus cervinus TaxID=181527 RepID=A0ACD3AH04_9AGAR|nr:hypothetical protein BDN72DRAFT_901828 [Pluteus cervinus]
MDDKPLFLDFVSDDGQWGGQFQILSLRSQHSQSSNRPLPDIHIFCRMGQNQELISTFTAKLQEHMIPLLPRLGMLRLVTDVPILFSLISFLNSNQFPVLVKLCIEVAQSDNVDVSQYRRMLNFLTISAQSYPALSSLNLKGMFDTGIIPDPMVQTTFPWNQITEMVWEEQAYCDPNICRFLSLCQNLVSCRIIYPGSNFDHRSWPFPNGKVRLPRLTHLQIDIIQETNVFPFLSTLSTPTLEDLTIGLAPRCRTGPCPVAALCVLRDSSGGLVKLKSFRGTNFNWTTDLLLGFLNSCPSLQWVDILHAICDIPQIIMDLSADPQALRSLIRFCIDVQVQTEPKWRQIHELLLTYCCPGFHGEAPLSFIIRKAEGDGDEEKIVSTTRYKFRSRPGELEFVDRNVS